ncbi:FAD-binding oxidoreductase [Rhizobium rhizogenes]|uniref:FAD-binding oxidoreductase n=1 Tax=Rhizobium rhizogenes TaxID=359 RepID=UPI0015722C91|nr:FAD-binding protein [Rhizobium rhizogenes]NTF65765.1 FAD-binding protein [Rhizobium rhizogenes]NTG97117.1 FAD-binding protein [Rhizobium rhizogenes]
MTDRSLTNDELEVLAGIVGPAGIKSGLGDRECYSYDAYIERHSPSAVIHPTSAEQVSAIVKLCNARGIPFVARGSGTGYAGGSVPVTGGLALSLTKMRRIAIDTERLTLRAEAGAITSEIVDAAARAGLRYPPIPSSYQISTIGGNIGTNAGGPHCLGYGVTTSYILELQVVTPDGEICTFGGRNPLTPALDVRGVLIGSEGTLGIVTSVTVRLIPAPKKIATLLCSYATPDPALATLERIFHAGLLPHAFDLCTGTVLPHRGAIEYDGATIAYIDIEGYPEEVHDKASRIARIVEECDGTAEHFSKNEMMKRRMDATVARWRKVVDETKALRWFLFDAVVPRSALARVLARTAELAMLHRLPMNNTFHAGDGNIHPCVFYDPTDERDLAARTAFFEDVYREVRLVGGLPSGEHGIGLEKRDMMSQFFPAPSLAVFAGVKKSFDPVGISNPDKVLCAPKTVQRPRQWELPPNDRIELHILDGYVKAQADVSKAEIIASLRDTPYELALDPIGWCDSMALAQVIEFGRPGLRDHRFGPSRDKFLGGVYDRSGQTLVVGSPFAKDVSGYDIRKLAYGGGALFGALHFAWLAIRPRECELWLSIKTRADDLHRVYSGLVAMDLPLSVLAIAATPGERLGVRVAISGIDDLTAKAAERIREAFGLTASEPYRDPDPWLRSISNQARWRFAEFDGKDFTCGILEESAVGFCLPRLSFGAIAVDENDDDYRLSRPDDNEFSERLRLQIGHR